MSWFPAQPDQRPGPSWPQDSFTLVPFFQGLLELSPEALLASWAGAPHVEDPRQGLVQGAEAFTAYVRETREWLALSDATARPLAVTRTAMRSVEEVLLDPEVGGARQELGAAVVAEWDRDHRLTAVRVYHALPLVAGQRAHLPTAPVEADQSLPPFVRPHLRGRSDDLEARLATYEDDAQVSSATATSVVVSGRQDLRSLHGVPTVPGGGRHATLCTVTDDGLTCAVEHRVSWDGAVEPVEAGITVYQRGPHGRIQRERRYLVPATAAFEPTATPGWAASPPRPTRRGRGPGSYATAASADG